MPGIQKAPFWCVASTKSVEADVLLFCFVFCQIRGSLVSWVNQIIREYSRTRKLIWLICSSLWVVTRRTTSEGRNVQNRVLRRTHTLRNQSKNMRYVTPDLNTGKTFLTQTYLQTPSAVVFSWFISVCTVLTVSLDFPLRSLSVSLRMECLFFTKRSGILDVMTLHFVLSFLFQP